VVEYAGCITGQNDWKVKDGYRIKCMISRRLNLVWDGDFIAKRDAIVAPLRERCKQTLPDGKNNPIPTRSGGFNAGPRYSCGNDFSVDIYGARSTSVTADDGLVSVIAYRRRLDVRECRLRPRLSKRFQRRSGSR
jgi:hypothetical protein